VFALPTKWPDRQGTYFADFAQANQKCWSRWFLLNMPEFSLQPPQHTLVGLSRCQHTRTKNCCQASEHHWRGEHFHHVSLHQGKFRNYSTLIGNYCLPGREENTFVMRHCIKVSLEIIRVHILLGSDFQPTGIVCRSTKKFKTDSFWVAFSHAIFFSHNSANY
jgi:hypothetical protein